jgi:hypothetical protein
LADDNEGMMVRKKDGVTGSLEEMWRVHKTIFIENRGACNIALHTCQAILWGPSPAGSFLDKTHPLAYSDAIRIGD